MVSGDPLKTYYYTLFKEFLQSLGGLYYANEEGSVLKVTRHSVIRYKKIKRIPTNLLPMKGTYLKEVEPGWYVVKRITNQLKENKFVERIKIADMSTHRRVAVYVKGKEHGVWVRKDVFSI